MNAVERIQAAIDKLGEWRGAKVPSAVSRAVMKSAKRGHAQSMLGLVRLSDDRTIDAQLSILTHGYRIAAHFDPAILDKLSGTMRTPITHALLIADAILGPDPH